MPCPYCRKTKLTIVTSERSTLQIFYFSLLCLFIIILWPCAYLVWRNTNLMNYHHSCANCHSRISTHNPAKAKKLAKKIQESCGLNSPGSSPLVSVRVTTKKRLSESPRSSIHNSRASRAEGGGLNPSDSAGSESPLRSNGSTRNSGSSRTNTSGMIAIDVKD